MAAELVDMIGIEKAEKYNTSLCLNFFLRKSNKLVDGKFNSLCNVGQQF